MNTLNVEKYQALVLYICEKLGGKIEGKKKLAKLLYFVDFDMFEYKESMVTVTGDTYKALPMGPVPNNYMSIIETLEKEGFLVQESKTISEKLNPVEVFTIKKTNSNYQDIFNQDERFIVDRVISNYGALNGKQLEDLTHGEAPWNGVNIGEKIPFELSFYRETSF